MDTDRQELHLASVRGTARKAGRAAGRVRAFDPAKHPRDHLGRFTKKLDSLSDNRSMRLPGGFKITRKGSKFRMSDREGNDREMTKRQVVAWATRQLGGAAMDAVDRRAMDRDFENRANRRAERGGLGRQVVGGAMDALERNELENRMEQRRQRRRRLSQDREDLLGDGLQLNQEIDLDEYERVLAAERAELGLAVTFGKIDSSTKGKPVTAKVRDLRTPEQKAKDAEQDGDFEEKHPRATDGKFIQKGSSGAEVRAAAHAMGFGELTSDFDDEFERAVRQYQRQNGLLVDGIVGRQTAAAMLDNEDADSVAPGEIRQRQVSRLLRQMRQSRGSRQRSR